MAFILQGIHSLEQHLQHILDNPNDYRPNQCPHCGKIKLWHHGFYGRQADREHGGRDSLNLVPVPRFPLSFLQTKLFNVARMPCAETLVSVAYPTDCSGVTFA